MPPRARPLHLTLPPPRPRRRSRFCTADEHVLDLGKFGRRTARVPMRVLVHLPPRYEEESPRCYPVLYMLDGQNIFDEATAFLGQCWHADRIHDALLERELIRPFVIAAIESGPLRDHLYTPEPDPHEGGGELWRMERFLLEELDPYLRTHFRLLSGPARTGILGSSLGGLAAFHLAWRHPEVFGLAGVMSPSLWWSGGSTLEMVAASRGPKRRLKLWIDFGTEEDDDDESSEDEDFPYEDFDGIAAARELGELMDERGHDVQVFIDPGAPHTEGAWRRRLPFVFTYLFGTGRRRGDYHEDE